MYFNELHFALWRTNEATECILMSSWWFGWMHLPLRLDLNCLVCCLFSFSLIIIHRGVSAIAFSTNGSCIYSAGADGMVCKIDSLTGNLLGKFRASTKSISSMAVSSGRCFYQHSWYSDFDLFFIWHFVLNSSSRNGLSSILVFVLPCIYALVYETYISGLRMIMALYYMKATLSVYS